MELNGRCVRTFRILAEAVFEGSVSIVAEAVGLGTIQRIVVEKLPNAARKIWQTWNDEAPEAVREELRSLVNARPEEVRKAALQVGKEIAKRAGPAIGDAAAAYLARVPDAVRASLRSPIDRSGRTVGAHALPLGPDDVLRMLPHRMPTRKPGDRPMKGVDLELVELLGTGGFGEVWKAQNPHLRNQPPVALKFCDSEDAKERLLHEANLLDRIQALDVESGIVRLNRTYLGADPPCLEYELVEGIDLAQVMREQHRRGSLDPRGVAAILRDLAETVGRLHAKAPPIVHRDLKPSNVLTRDGKQFLVADFGIGGIAAAAGMGTAAEDAVQFSRVRGACTPLYASPQQQKGAAADPRDDVHALGVIWYQFMLGDLAAARPSGDGWKRTLQTKGMDQRLIHVLTQCLEEDPGDRPRNGGALAELISAALSPRPQEPRPRAGARKLAALLSAVAAMALLVRGGSSWLGLENLLGKKANAGHSAPSEANVAVPPADVSSASSPTVIDAPTAQAIAPVATTLEYEQLGKRGFPGLEPLGKNEFGLFEYSHPASGTRPKRGANGQFVIEDGTGLVFTLIPGGTYTIGAQSKDPKGKHYVARAFDCESPVHDVALAPYLIAKYEMTRGQWQRLAGNDPSRNANQPSQRERTLAYPMENVSWDDCVAALRKAGLALPTEAQWEAAARARTTTPWWCGATEEALMGKVAYGQGDKNHTVPVDAHGPNLFGLFNVLGNVWEWCEDGYSDKAYATVRAREGDGLREVSGSGGRVSRGGSAWFVAGDVRAAIRIGISPGDRRLDGLGVRPVLAP